jgi:hypothetical protein
MVVTHVKKVGLRILLGKINCVWEEIESKR